MLSGIYSTKGGKKKFKFPQKEDLNAFVFLCLFRYPSLKTIRELIYKRGHGKVNHCRIPITDNTIIEKALGKHNILCTEDLIHEIYTVGPKFKEANNFLWPFKLSNPKRGGFLGKKMNHFVQGGEFGNRETKIDDLISRMN